MSAPRVVVHTGDILIDVTEAVKTMYDLLASSMDWGSHFLSIEDVTEMTRLAEACGFVGLESAQEQLVEYMSTLAYACPICNKHGVFVLAEPLEHGRRVRVKHTDFPPRTDGLYGLDYSKPTESWDPHEAILIQPQHEPAYLYWPDLDESKVKS